jgi:hypothetical protein
MREVVPREGEDSPGQSGLELVRLSRGPKKQ